MSKSRNDEGGLSRRGFNLLAGAGAMFGLAGAASARQQGGACRGNGGGPGGGVDGNGVSLPATPFNFVPFTREMPRPATKTPVAIIDPSSPSPANFPWQPGNVHHGIAPEYFNHPSDWQRGPLHLYELDQRPGVAEILPGVQTPIWGYDGLYPGPTFRGRIGQPMVVRVSNNIPHETSVHLHGAHTPAHGDGYPNFFVSPGQQRDYYYPNIVPRKTDGSGEFDYSESPSTMWYHDHGMDLTAENCIKGLAGFHLFTDDLEEQLIADNVLPSGAQDIPIVLQDRRLRSDGTIFFDPLDHNGYLGDIQVANGVAQPYIRVQRRKYRLRFLDGANARFYLLKLTSGNFTQIGNDSWLLPQAIETNELMLSPAKRADVIIDFRDAPSEVYLVNVLRQDSGRGPHGTSANPQRLNPGQPLIKFIVEGAPVDNDATVVPGTPLRPNHPIAASEVVATREFLFHRSNGAWMINGKFFDEFRADATPTLGTAEKWILRNGGGGWWHPIHMHLESHQIVRFNGQLPPPTQRHKNDVAILGPNDTAEIHMRFRTFTGPFVFHCHNLEHEDMRMMFVFDPRTNPTQAPQPIQAYYP
ncbi:MAG: multicopper oxidase family protein [Planctomycetia bacterium]